MGQIFLSHSTEDDAIAHTLRRAFYDFDREVWIDSPPDRGDPWPDLQRAIEEAEAYLILVSESGLQSSQVGKELREALAVQKQRGKDAYPVIPLSLDGTPLGALEAVFGDTPRCIPLRRDAGSIEAARDAILGVLGERESGDGSPALAADRTTAEPGFDVFLVHNSADSVFAAHLARKLRRQGIHPWIDCEQIAPGRSFQEVIQVAVGRARTAAVLIGPAGLGEWQVMEIEAFMSRRIEHGHPVIPVLLPGVHSVPESLAFLRAFNRVAFLDRDDEEALATLIWGIKSATDPQNHARLEPGRPRARLVSKWRYTCLGICLSSLVAIPASVVTQQRQPPEPASETAIATEIPLPTIARSGDSVLGRTELDKLFAELVTRVLVVLRKPDGSTQVLIDNATFRSQAWTTAQSLAGALSGPADAVIGMRRQILDGFNYIESARNPASAGWQRYPNVDASVAEPTAWATIAYSLALRHRAIWTDEEYESLRTRGAHAFGDLKAFYDETSGAFRTRLMDPPRYSYATALGLLAVIEAIHSGITKKEAEDHLLSLAVGHLLRQITLHDKKCRFRYSQDWQLTEEPLGLTAQIIYVLALAERLGIKNTAAACEAALLDEVSLAHRDARTDDAFQIVEGGYSKNIRTMWYPWTLLWLVERRSLPSSLDRKKLVDLTNQLLEQRTVQALVNTFGADETFRMAETMLAVGAGARLL